MSDEHKKELTDHDRQQLQKALELFGQKKYTEAISDLMKYAPYDALAASRVAEIFLFGYGDFEQNYEKANHWLQMAADMNDAWSSFALAIAYAYGRGVERDDSKALELYSKAYTLGYSAATNNLGVSYLNGEGTSVDEVKAFHLFEEASQKGNMYGVWNLGRCYEYALGTDCDLEKALELYREAERLGHPDAPAQIKSLQEKLTRQHSIDNIFLDIMPYFTRFHLNKLSEERLSDFFRFIIQTGDANFLLSNNMMIHCDDSERAQAFITQLSASICIILDAISSEAVFSDLPDDKFAAHRYFSEDDYITSKNIPLDSIGQYKVFSIYDDNAKWDSSFTNAFIHTCKQTSGTYKVLAAPEDVIRSKFKGNPHLYYRIFRTHIYINDIPASEAYRDILFHLDDRNIPYSIGFEKGLRDYVKTIYPKADLKNDSFVSDMLERLMTSYYGSKELPDRLTSRHIPYYRKTKSYEEAIRAFDDLTGLASVKEVFAELQYMIQESGTSAVPALHMAFVGNPGTGKTTVAQMTADLLYSMGVIRTDKVISVPALNLIGEYVGSTSKITHSYCKKAYDGILFIDEAYLLTPSGNKNGNDQFRQECIGTLIQEMENNRDRLIVIFAGYPKEMDDFLHNSNAGFASRLYKVVTFEDYSDNELMEIFENLCKKEKFSLSMEAKEKVRLKLTTQRYSRDFGNARTVRNVFIDARKKYREENGAGGDHIIQAEHIALETELRDYQTVSAELNSMIGLANAKAEIQRAVATCRFSLENKLDITISRHMLFLGNAGTGKSTVANLFCQMLFSIGAAKSPNCVSIAAGDLIGRSNPIEALNEYCTKAFGGVLFIDEAYELRSYCIPVLLDLMETQRDNITIILAGYDQEMNLFLSQNQGLKSRFPVTVHFDDYSVSELTEIFISLCEKYKFAVTDAAKEKFVDIIEQQRTLPNFGNARTVRNIFEQSYRKHAENFFNCTDEERRYVMDSEDIVALP